MENLVSLLVPYSRCNGDYKAYINLLYDYFWEDFIDSMPNFMGNDVDFTGKKRDDGKEETFWHVITQASKYSPKGCENKERNIDFKRAERIRWIKVIIENHDNLQVKHWIERENNKVRHYLWCLDEYLVILGEQYSYPYYHLVTAFYVSPTNRENYQKRYEKNAHKKTMSP